MSDERPPSNVAIDLLDAAMAASMAEMAEEGSALYELSRMRGFVVLMRQLERMDQDIGRHGLRDTERSRDYYVGAQDMVAKLRAMIPLAIERGAEAEAARLIVSKPDFARRFVSGSGDLS